MAAKRKATEIRMSPDADSHGSLVLSGWWDGELTYLWIGIGTRCIGTLSGAKLRRFAERVLREMPPPSPHGEGG